MPRLNFSTRRHRSRDASGAGGCLITLIFGGVFAAGGTGMFIFFTVLPFWNIYQARSWSATPCTITQSQVETHSDSDGDTYSIDIRFTYQYKGKRYNSDRYRFAPPGSSSGYSGKRKVVAGYPVDSKQTCYVDPDEPHRAVLNRGLTGALWLGLFPLPFMAVGYVVLYAGLTGKLKVGTLGSKSDWRPAGQHSAPHEDGSRDFFVEEAALTASASSTPSGRGDDAPIVLNPGKSRKANFIGITIFSVIWNGILWTIASFELSDYFQQSSNWSLIPILLMSPFLIIGLVLIGISAYNFMLIYAPVVVIELGRDTLPLGGSTLLRWHIAGRPGRVDQVKISLVGEEQATYSRGTDTSTDTKAFYKQRLVGEDQKRGKYDPAQTRDDRGEVIVQVPLDTMHSFNANNNKIVWKLVVKAEVPRWPDPKDEYDLTVLPLPVHSAEFHPAISR